MTNGEQETVVRWDREARTLEGCTTDASVMRRWQRTGCVVSVLGRTREGEPRSWSISLPPDAGRRAWRLALKALIPPRLGLRVEAGDDMGVSTHAD